MPTVKIHRHSKFPEGEAFRKISELLKDDNDLRRLDPKYEATFDESKLSGSATGAQFKATMQVKKSESGSQVELNVELPFHLTLVKGLVQKTLEKKLIEILG